MRKTEWPDNKQFAFTVFDDTDRTTCENGPPVYALLNDLGFRTTKSVWPVKGTQKPHTGGTTCEDQEYLNWVLRLQTQGFEIALHNVTYHTSTRKEIIQGLEHFKTVFGRYPTVHANHTGCYDGIYWGDARFCGATKLIYNMLTRYKNHRRFTGHCPESDLYWGDICQEKIKYVRNFVYQDINTLKACPQLPYHDPKKPFVNYWFASANGSPVQTFNQTISERNQDRLEMEGGACIMYTHFGSTFYRDGKLNDEFQRLMQRLSRKNGWFVPVTTLLDYILQVRGISIISSLQRTKIELRWLLGTLATRAYAHM